jgi:hypothetical protein
MTPWTWIYIFIYDSFLVEKKKLMLEEILKKIRIFEILIKENNTLLNNVCFNNQPSSINQSIMEWNNKQFQSTYTQNWKQQQQKQPAIIDLTKTHNTNTVNNNIIDLTFVDDDNPTQSSRLLGTGSFLNTLQKQQQQQRKVTTTHNNKAHYSRVVSSSSDSDDGELEWDGEILSQSRSDLKHKKKKKKSRHHHHHHYNDTTTTIELKSDNKLKKKKRRREEIESRNTTSRQSNDDDVIFVNSSTNNNVPNKRYQKSSSSSTNTTQSPPLQVHSDSSHSENTIKVNSSSSSSSLQKNISKSSIPEKSTTLNHKPPNTFSNSPTNSSNNNFKSAFKLPSLPKLNSPTKTKTTTQKPLTKNSLPVKQQQQQQPVTHSKKVLTTTSTSSNTNTNTNNNLPSTTQRRNPNECIGEVEFDGMKHELYPATESARLYAIKFKCNALGMLKQSNKYRRIVCSCNKKGHIFSTTIDLNRDVEITLCPLCKKNETSDYAKAQRLLEDEQRQRDIEDQERLFAAAAKRLHEEQQRTKPTMVPPPPFTTTAYNNNNTNKINDPYQILGIARNSSIQVIKARWHMLARKLHPDKNNKTVHDNSTTTTTAKEFCTVKDAYDSIIKSLGQ